MSSIKSIYLNYESELILEKRKKSNKDFNFSQFISDALLKPDRENVLTLEYIEENIKKHKLMKKQADESVEHWKKLKKDLINEEAQEEERTHEKEDYNKKRDKIIEYTSDLHTNEEKKKIYLDGKKQGKWNSTTEFAKAMIQ